MPRREVVCSCGAGRGVASGGEVLHRCSGKGVQPGHFCYEHVVLVARAVEHVKTEFDAFENVERCQSSDSGDGGVVVVEDSVCAAQGDMRLGLALQLVSRPCEVQLDWKL